MKHPLQGKRNRIDAIDNQVISLLVKRMQLVKDLSAIKRKFNLPVHDPIREKEILIRLCRFDKNVPAEYIQGLYRFIFEQGRKQQLKRNS